MMIIIILRPPQSKSVIITKPGVMMILVRPHWGDRKAEHVVKLLRIGGTSSVNLVMKIIFV